mmetsp:Transcript_3782/g.7933  ORF Transcript_3782/g.7933 Transcript_3782/m.7933 type:complete len:160 (+) Transcript_3782:85-564(+)|eukprot:CAMPEP_0194324582 /NCGR_PEP_ID=MMETSP0171-20130528/28625_1 /TAXON_ID=218684 /ORGANISM="Corethron pennatum, Strain L29A3" /LENGTH=159 /DNA_ID=CAMNT_0039083519 /DNA_START=85 /DNA_END=564 /DNA_ORIENTATION=-
MPTSTEAKPPFPPFTRETATQKVRMAEDAWNSKDPDRVKMAYSPDSVWRNRTTFVTGRDEIRDFLSGKWEQENGYKLIKELWCCADAQIAVRFCYEYHDAAGAWFRACGNENWEFDDDGLMRVRHASINDVPIDEVERKFRWEGDQRPDDHPGLSALGL